MTRRFRRIAVLLCVLLLSTWGPALAGPSSDPTRAAQQPLVVHEWGTFTSIAGPDGGAVSWLPLGGPTDLPCFVNRFAFNVKGSLPATVRMETPVLYFYGPAGTVVDVNVRFQQGLISEWFPAATGLVTPAPQTVSLTSLFRSGFSSGITWNGVRLLTPQEGSFPREAHASHYYAARHTDASALQSGTAQEKFLFYRGIGGFQPPITATVAGSGQIVVKSANGDALGDVVLFDNRRGEMTYRVWTGVTENELRLDPPSADGEFAAPLAELEQILIARGLYPKEAKAMVDTWRDSWFEEGTRLFYIAPRPTIDAILPLTVNPVPSDVVRVFVGRIELLTDSRAREIDSALRARDWTTLSRYGRFLEPLSKRFVSERPPVERTQMESTVRTIAASPVAPASSCR